MIAKDKFGVRLAGSVLILFLCLPGMANGSLLKVNAAQAKPLCLVYRQMRGTHPSLFQMNVNTGKTNLLPSTVVPVDAGGVVSPNGKTLAYVTRDESGDTAIVLATAHGQPMMYIAQDNVGNGGPALISPDNAERRSLFSLGKRPEYDVRLAGWSADGDYRAFTWNAGLTDDLAYDKVQLGFVSVQDWKMSSASTPVIERRSGANAGEFVQPTWSPLGHDIAYITAQADHVALVIAAPDVGIKQTMPLRTGKAVYISAIHWSADGRYVAVGSVLNDLTQAQTGPQPYGGDWHVSILGVDGTARPDVLQENLYGFDTTTAVGWWSAGGHTWIFWHSYGTNPNAPDYSLLSAYDVDGRRVEVLARNVLADYPPQPIADGKAAVVALGPSAGASDRSRTIALISSDGKNQRTLLGDVGKLSWPYLPIDPSAPGIAIASPSGIIWTWADGSGTQTLTTDISGYSSDYPWLQVFASPSGQEVAVQFTDGPTQQTLALLSADKGQPVRVWHQQQATFGQVSWSADGSMLAFVQSGDIQTVYIVAADGTPTAHWDLAGSDPVTLVAWAACTQDT